MMRPILTVTFESWSSNDWISVFLVTLIVSSLLWQPVESSTECTKRQFLMTFTGTPINSTIPCSMYFQWTVSDFCCYSKYDRYDNNPYCCYSDTYKLLVAVGLICGTLIGASCMFFTCWAYDVPHHILFILTCGKFKLKNWLKRNALNGPYVDPSFYSGESFWSRRNAEFQPYPLRPMPPRIFYPAAPTAVKFRWDGINTSNGQIPLFIVASRQFTRNPYSARPSDRTLATVVPPSAGGQISRRSSTPTLAEGHTRIFPILDFTVPLNEVEAASELLEALKRLEEKKIPEESSVNDDEIITVQPVTKSHPRLTHQPCNKRKSIEDCLHFFRPSTTASAISNRDEPFLKSASESRRGSELVEAVESLSVFRTPPAMPFTNVDGPRELQRVNIPYISPKLPGTIPD